MKIQISSGFTLFYKYVLFPCWGLLGMGVTGWACLQMRELTPALIFFGLVLIMILLAWLMIRKLRMVSYDEKYVYLKDLRYSRTLELIDIRSINEGSILSFDPWFEIELYPVNGTVEKFDFMPEIHEHIAYSFFGTLSKKLIGFKRAILRGKSPDQLTLGKG